jgi:hypothetical protein
MENNGVLYKNEQLRYLDLGTAASNADEVAQLAEDLRAEESAGSSVASENAMPTSHQEGLAARFPNAAVVLADPMAEVTRAILAVEAEMPQVIDAIMKEEVLHVVIGMDGLGLQLFCGRYQKFEQGLFKLCLPGVDSPQQSPYLSSLLFLFAGELSTHARIGHKLCLIADGVLVNQACCTWCPVLLTLTCRAQGARPASLCGGCCAA